MKFEKLPSEEMSQIKGGAWVILEDGRWIWVNPLDLDENDF